jgi:hypothetical protein
MKKNIKKISKLEKEFEDLLKEGHNMPSQKTIKNYDDIPIDELEKEFENILTTHNLPKKELIPDQQIVTEHDKYVQEMEEDLKKLDQLEQNLTLDLKSAYVMKKRLGELFNFTSSHDIETNVNTVDLISEIIYDKYYNFVRRQMKKKYKQGFETAIKLTFSNSIDASGLSSITIRNNQLTQDMIKERINHDIINKFHGGDSEFLPLFKYATYFVFPLSINGGCSCDKKIMEKIKYKNRTIKLISPKSTNDNCLFMCFTYFLNIKGNTLRFNDIRKELNIPDGKIHYDKIRLIANYFECGYILLNQIQEIISFKDIENKPKCHIMLMNDHYYIVEYLDYNNCNQCGQKTNVNIEHKCDPKRVTYYRSRKCNKREFVDMIDCTDKEKIKEDSMIFFDLETFQETIYHVPYACGFSYGDHKNVDISYGKNCMNNFINHIIKAENKTICAYNGAGFDNFIVLNYLKDKNIEIKNLILCNGCILSFKFGQDGKENKFFDLYRFINSSLDKACKAYDIKNHKMKFDVLKIQSWDLAEKYRDEVEPYLKYDVLSLSELFFTFNDSIFSNDNVNITKYITLSNMAYSLWQKTLTDLVEIPSMDKYDFIKRGTYGARCYPMQKEFKSKHYDEIINKKMSYEELEKTKEYIFNADATSLYPASMKGVDFINVQYPTGSSRWSITPKEEFDNNKWGIYEVSFTCPKDIIIPVLPRKTESGGLEWSLYDGEGVYTNIEIKNALSVGYKVYFINKCLVWDSTGNVFNSYVEKYYKMKEDSEKENNPVKRSIAKLLLNAMYGKTLQKAIFENTAIICNYNQLLEFFKDYDIKDVSVLSDSKLIMTGTCKNKEERITKPCQLGAFVLSYSREIMLHFMKVIDPSLKTHVFTYTDTDSLHILGNHAQKLREKGLIKPKSEASLGYLCSDVDNEGLIIYENNLAPKTYFYEYIDNNNKIADKENGTMKGKGIPKKVLKHNMYSDYKEKPQVVEFSGLRRKHKNLTKSDIENKLPYFSIINNTQTRQFMKNEWGGMIFKDNKYYPKGYVF